MKKDTLFFLVGLISLLALFAGIFKKITHQRYADLILTIGLLAFGIFWIMTIWDVLNQSYGSRIYKMLWLALVIGALLIGSLIYHFIKPYKSKS